ncbi:hypothetical protein ACGC1H_000456 [Rhizoctonia solani]
MQSLARTISVSRLCSIRLPTRSFLSPTLRTASMASRSGTQASPPAKKMAHFPKLESQAADSPDFRRVLWTGEHSQLVIMTIPVDGEIGEEVHTVDQVGCLVHNPSPNSSNPLTSIYFSRAGPPKPLSLAKKR